jgi:adenylate cyclase
MKPTVVFVDDDSNLRESVKRSLRNEEYRLLAVASAQQCVDLLAVTNVHVIVSDLSMPGFSGATLINYFRKANPDVVRIVLSGNLTLTTVLDLINEGQVFRCLEKPCSGSQLAFAIREALTQSDLILRTKRLLSLPRSSNLGRLPHAAEDGGMGAKHPPEEDVENLILDAVHEVEKLDHALSDGGESEESL